MGRSSDRLGDVLGRLAVGALLFVLGMALMVAARLAMAVVPVLWDGVLRVTGAIVDRLYEWGAIQSPCTGRTGCMLGAGAGWLAVALLAGTVFTGILVIAEALAADVSAVDCARALVRGGAMTAGLISVALPLGLAAGHEVHRRHAKQGWWG